MRGLNKYRGIEIICVICKTSFKVKPSWANKRKYCSMKCVGIGQRSSFLKEKNPFWKGEEITYTGIHQWLTREYGRPEYCENPNCEKKSSKYEWAKKKDKQYARKRENFLRLCKSCHGTYDGLVQNFRKN